MTKRQRNVLATVILVVVVLAAAAYWLISRNSPESAPTSSLGSGGQGQSQPVLPVNAEQFTEQAATDLAAALTSGDRTRFTEAIAAYDGWKPNQTLVKQYSGIHLKLLTGTTEDRGNGATATALFEEMTANSDRVEWQVMFVRQPGGPWQIFDTKKVKR
jgi:hypothetical protein